MTLFDEKQHGDCCPSTGSEFPDRSGNTTAGTIRRAEREREFTEYSMAVNQRTATWHTRNRFRVPKTATIKESRARVDAAIADHGGQISFLPGGEIMLPWPLYVAYTCHLNECALPITRYHRWANRGRLGIYHPVYITSVRVGLGEDKSEEVQNALLEIEPYPSKKLVDSTFVSIKLFDLGVRAMS